MDVTSLLAEHLDTLLPGEQTFDLQAYLRGVRASASSLDDLNTAVYLDLR